AAPAQPAVDESALRYFASRGDNVRLQAEISRLQALYPNWVPPADPLALPQNGDKQLEAMWQLYSDGLYAELRKAVADRQAADAGWQP
ncbi:cellulose synthase, partial [Rhizobium ruizarguesonis]